jgi:hypothetical protein
MYIRVRVGVKNSCKSRDVNWEADYLGQHSASTVCETVVLVKCACT